MFYCNQITGVHMPVQNVNHSINNNYQINNPMLKKRTFESFVPENFVYPKIPINASKAYATPQLYPEYKVLETFKLPNTGVGKVYQLRNGHKVIVLPKKGPTVINTLVAAGWQNEKPDKRDTAHMLEHLLATIQYKKNARELQEISDNIILESNAATGSCYTNYYEKALVTDDKELDKLLKYHFAIVNSADFSDKNFEHEKVTISNEMNFRNDNKTGEDVATDAGLNSLLNLPAQNELSHTVTQKNIDNINKNDLYDFYNKYYRPDNMVTAIVGNVDENTIKTFSKYFNQVKNPLLKSKDTYLNKLVENPIQKAVRKDIITPDKNQKSYLIELDFFVNDKMNTYEKECLSLATGLVRDSVRNEIDETTATISPIINSDFDKNVISINSEIEHSYSEKILQNIYNIINDLGNNPISEDELNRLKKLNKGAALLNTAESLADYFSSNLSFNNFVTPEKTEEIYNRISAQDIQATIKKYFDLNKAALTVVHPQEKTKQPSFKGTLKLTDLYNISEYTLPNNIKVNINESDSVNESSINFMVSSKKILDSHSCARKYLRNAINLTGVGYLCENNGIMFKVESDERNLRYDLLGEPEQTTDMLNSIIYTLLHPVLSSEEDLAKWKHINKDINTVNNIAIQRYNDESYKDTPWRNKKDDVQKLTLKNVQDYHSDLLKNAQVAVNITLPKNCSSQYKQQIFNILSCLPKFQPYNHSEYFHSIQAKPLEKNKVFLNINDNNLLEIVKSYKMIKTGNIKDIVGISLLNFILGEDFDGMLYKKLRFDKNLTYSTGSEYVNSSFVPNYGIFNMVSYADKDNLQQVNANFEECIKQLMTEPVSEKDLNIAKKKFKSGFWGESALTQNFMGKECDNSFYGLNYISELDKAIDEITPQDIRELVQYYFSQPSLYMISGNKEAIEANIEYLKNLGEICC